MLEREPLTEDALLEKLADWTVRKGMTVPAILFLDSHRHLNFIGSQFLVLFQPMLGVLFDPAGIETVVATMEKRENVERLLILIEQKDQDLRERQRAEKEARREARRKRRDEKRAAKLARKAEREAS